MNLFLTSFNIHNEEWQRLGCVIVFTTHTSTGVIAWSWNPVIDRGIWKTVFLHVCWLKVIKKFSDEIDRGERDSPETERDR